MGAERRTGSASAGAGGTTRPPAAGRRGGGGGPGRPASPVLARAPASPLLLPGPLHAADTLPNRFARNAGSVESERRPTMDVPGTARPPDAGGPARKWDGKTATGRCGRDTRARRTRRSREDRWASTSGRESVSMKWPCPPPSSSPRTARSRAGLGAMDALAARERGAPPLLGNTRPLPPGPVVRPRTRAGGAEPGGVKRS